MPITATRTADAAQDPSENGYSNVAVVIGAVGSVTVEPALLSCELIVLPRLATPLLKMA